MDEYIKNNNITEIRAIMGLHVGINCVMGLSVVIKNISNYYLIEIFKYKKKITNLLWLEIISFIIPSFIFLIYLLEKDCNCKCSSEKKNKNNNENKSNSKNNENSNENNNKNNVENKDNNTNNNKKNDKSNEVNNYNGEEINYFAGYIFVKTETIYSFIKVKGLNRYILSILTNAKVVFILIINL